MQKFDRITIEPGKLSGQPCIRGMRISVRRALELMATYWDRAELFQSFPELEEEDLKQALLYASLNLADEYANVTVLSPSEVSH